MTTARSNPSFDDDRIRVTTWTFQDGQDTGHHRHEYDYLVVPISGGTFAITEPDGSTREMTQEAAVAYLGRAGTEHNVINRSGDTAVFVEVELKP
jgi:quercetin dioxygenase-like cupin family protein